MRKSLPALVAAILALAPAAPAEALQFATSSTTGKSVMLIPLRTNGGLAGGLGYTFGLRVVPSPSDVLGPLAMGAGVKEGFGYMGDLDLGLRYKHTLLDVNFLGRFNPAITGSLGWRGIAAGYSADLASSALATGGVSGGLSYVHGPHLGVGAETEIPLGFSGYANAGTTLLTGGGWNGKQVGVAGSGDASGSLNPQGMMLPLFGLGAAWQPFGPVFRVAVGYDFVALPTHFRTQAPTLASGVTWVNGFSIGLTLLGLSI